MTFTLIIYIYIDLPNSVNVTMYCYMHVLRIFVTTCIPECVTQQNRCLTATVSTDGRQEQATDHRTLNSHTCVLYHMTQASLTLLRCTETILYPLSVYCILYTVLRLYYLSMLYYMKTNGCSYISYFYNVFIY